LGRGSLAASSRWKAVQLELSVARWPPIVEIAGASARCCRPAKTRQCRHSTNLRPRLWRARTLGIREVSTQASGELSGRRRADPISRKLPGIQRNAIACSLRLEAAPAIGGRQSSPRARGPEPAHISGFITSGGQVTLGIPCVLKAWRRRLVSDGAAEEAHTPKNGANQRCSRELMNAQAHICAGVGTATTSPLSRREAFVASAACHSASPVPRP
jgi:hypothetical protein